MPQRQTSNAYCQWHAFMFVLKIAMSSWHLREIPPAASLTLAFSRLTVLFTLTLHLLPFFASVPFFILWFYCVIFLWLYLYFCHLLFPSPSLPLSCSFRYFHFLLSTWFKIASNRYDCSLWCKISLEVYHCW